MEQLEARKAAFTGNCVECFDEDIPCRYCERGKEKVQREWDAREREARERAISNYVSGAGIPLRFQELTFASYPSDAKAPIERFVESWDGRRNLLLLGRYGVGKTGLIAAALNALAERLYDDGKRPKFISTVALTDALRSGYDDGSFDRTMETYRKCGLLILDDLGAEKPTEWVRERIFSIIDYRYGAFLPTWGTSNLTPDKLAEQIGERAFWRLVEECDVIEVSGVNLRERREPAKVPSRPATNGKEHSRVQEWVPDR